MRFNRIPWKVEFIDKFGRRFVWYRSGEILELNFSNNFEIYVTKEKGDQRRKVWPKNILQAVQSEVGDDNLGGKAI